MALPGIAAPIGVAESVSTIEYLLLKAWDAMDRASRSGNQAGVVEAQTEIDKLQPALDASKAKSGSEIGKAPASAVTKPYDTPVVDTSSLPSQDPRRQQAGPDWANRSARLRSQGAVQALEDIRSAKDEGHARRRAAQSGTAIDLGDRMDRLPSSEVELYPEENYKVASGGGNQVSADRVRRAGREQWTSDFNRMKQLQREGRDEEAGVIAQKINESKGELRLDEPIPAGASGREITGSSQYGDTINFRRPAVTGQRLSQTSNSVAVTDPVTGRVRLVNTGSITPNFETPPSQPGMNQRLNAAKARGYVGAGSTRFTIGTGTTDDQIKEAMLADQNRRGTAVRGSRAGLLEDRAIAAQSRAKGLGLNPPEMTQFTSKGGPVARGSRGHLRQARAQKIQQGAFLRAGQRGGGGAAGGGADQGGGMVFNPQIYKQLLAESPSAAASYISTIERSRSEFRRDKSVQQQNLLANKQVDRGYSLQEKEYAMAERAEQRGVDADKKVDPTAQQVAETEGRSWDEPFGEGSDMYQPWKKARLLTDGGDQDTTDHKITHNSLVAAHDDEDKWEGVVQQDASEFLKYIMEDMAANPSKYPISLSAKDILAWYGYQHKRYLKDELKDVDPNDYDAHGFMYAPALGAYDPAAATNPR
jgi:hypothetical protein